MRKVLITKKPFACAEFFFRCLETLPGDGTGSMRDTIRGAEYAPVGITGAPIPMAGSYTLNNSEAASNAIFPECDTSIGLLSGSWPNFKRRSVITFACGRLVDPDVLKIPVGNGSAVIPGSDGNISVSFGGGGMHTLLRDADGTQVSIAPEPLRALPAIGTDIGVLVEYSPATDAGPGSITSKVIDMAGNTYGSGETETKQTAQVLNQFDLNPGLNNLTRFRGMAFYSFIGFSFDEGLPANRNEAYLWMLNNHAAGIRHLPPQFRYHTSSR